MSKRERQMLVGAGVALLLYYLFTKKPKWFTALYQTGGEGTPTSADDYGEIGGGAGFTATGTDGTGDLISDPNSDATSDGGGVMENLLRTDRTFEYYDPAYQKKKPKGSRFRSGGGGEADSDDALIVDGGIRGPNRTIAPVSVLR